ncbi:MAG: alpha/beta fold hydrolase [Candidatus Binataceae bacterium]
MPTFERDGISLYYEEFGSGYPLFLFAPGGMRSSVEFWHQSPFDPTREFAADFRVIAMDQRNAGRSHAPVAADNGWHTYTTDHIALLDHLGIQRCHIMGGCIGSSYCLSLIQAAPQRISAGVLQNPIGRSVENGTAFQEMFDGWAKNLKSAHSEIAAQGFESFRENMYGGDFVFSVSHDFVRGCQTPLLILAGNDLYHPTPIAQEIAQLAPDNELIMTWKTPETVGEAVRRVRDFLTSHRP